MREFNYYKIKNQKWDSEILELIGAINRETGKQELYLKQKPQELEKLIEIAKIQSIEGSNAIEGIVTTDTRLKKIINEKTSPKNRSEKEIMGYRDVLNLIHENYQSIPITKNFILQLHSMLFSRLDYYQTGKLKTEQNYIVAHYPDGRTEIKFIPLNPFETEIALEKICEEYNKVMGNQELDPLITIATFIHDFLCIHPFSDGNGRISRLLTTLLLYKNGFYVGKYISLESIINKNKDVYYEALENSQIGWHEGKEDKNYFIKFILQTILYAYKEFRNRFEIVEEKLTALEQVRKAISLRIGKFTKKDLTELIPSLSTRSIERSLKELVESGEIKKEGKGRGTYYVRQKY